MVVGTERRRKKSSIVKSTYGVLTAINVFLSIDDQLNPFPVFKIVTFESFNVSDSAIRKVLKGQSGQYFVFRKK